MLTRSIFFCTQLSILNEAKSLGITKIWLQPGSEDQTVIEWIKNQENREEIIFGGDCILVLGGSMLTKEKGRKEEGAKI